MYVFVSAAEHDLLRVSMGGVVLRLWQLELASEVICSVFCIGGTCFGNSLCINPVDIEGNILLYMGSGTDRFLKVVS